MSNLISIIIPTFNRAHLIGETLDSIVAQTYSNWECIVVDDGSTDETATLIAKYILKDNRFQYYQRPVERIRGANACRNYGFDLSKGDYIKWFDSDDIMHQNLLEKQLNTIDRNIECSVCKIAYYDFENNRVLKENTIYSDNLIEDYLVGDVVFYVSGPLWNRSFLEKQSELFDETLSNLDDWDFNLRMLYQKPTIAFIDKPLIIYRIHQDSLSQEIGKLNFKETQSEFRARKKHLFLLKINKLANPVVLQNYIKARYKFILREALVTKDENRFYYLKKLSISQIEVFDFRGFIKTIFGFTSFSVFNKGYKLLK